MEAYIDYASFCSYLGSRSHVDFKKCDSALLSNCNIHFTFDKKDFFNAKKEIKRLIENWVKDSTRNRNGHKNEWNCKSPLEPLNSVDYSLLNKSQLSSLYMSGDNNACLLHDKGCLLVAPIGKELEILKNLQVASTFIPTKQYRIREMKNWDRIGDNSSPCTDIILVDQYIFSQSDFEYNVNSYALLEQLCKWAKNETINIVIFTFAKYQDNNVYYDVPFNTIERNLKDRLGSLIGKIPNITFVVLPQKEQHDRTIVTNYKMFTSGDSFKYFKEGQNVSLCTHGEWMYTSSLLDDDILKQAGEFMTDMQIVVDKVKGGIMSIFGDKKSNFLDFE